MSFTIAPHIKGLIFDADGTLVDTMPLHYLAWLDIVRAQNGDFPEELFYELAGVPSDTIVDTLNQKFGYQLDPHQIAADKEALFLEKYLAHAQPIAPVIEIAKAYKGRLPMAVATGGIPMVVNRALKVIGLQDFFDAIVTANDVERGKPAPDPFLEAARRIGVQPELCQVFEDSEAGLAGARKAGMVATDVRPWLQAQPVSQS